MVHQSWNKATRITDRWYSVAASAGRKQPAIVADWRFEGPFFVEIVESGQSLRDNSPILQHSLLGSTVGRTARRPTRDYAPHETCMAELAAEIVAQVVETCKAGADEATEALARALDANDLKLTVGEPGTTDPQALS